MKEPTKNTPSKMACSPRSNEHILQEGEYSGEYSLILETEKAVYIYDCHYIDMRESNPKGIITLNSALVLKINLPDEDDDIEFVNLEFESNDYSITKIQTNNIIDSSNAISTVIRNKWFAFGKELSEELMETIVHKVLTYLLNANQIPNDRDSGGSHPMEE